MSSPAIALPPAPPAKPAKKKAKTKAGPTLSKLILKAVAASKGRSGLSLAGLKKALKAGGYDVVKNRTRLVLAIKRLVANKSLVRTKGSGASGSFKVNKKAPKPRKRVLKKRKKTTKAKKAKKTKAKKAGASSAKKVPKKKKKKATKKKAKAATKTTSPRKAKKPAAAKKTVKPKTPKRPKRRVARATKTAAAAKK